MKPKQLARPAKGLSESFSAQVSPETLNAANRSVDVLFFSGADMPRIDWNTGQPYLMRFDPKGVDLTRLNNGGAVLDCHSNYQMANQLGCVDKAWQSGGKFYATLRFSKRTEVDPIWQDITDRIIQNFSMGVFIDSKKDITADGDPQKIVLVTKWQPFEISLIPVPADANTTTLSALGDEPEAPTFDAAIAAARRRQIQILRLRQ